VKTKQVERVSEVIGEQMEAVCRRQSAASLSGKIVVLPTPVPKMYIAIDGTGVPMVARETEARQGKDPSGKAKTREAKLGCVFTQTTVDAEGWPVRDDNSTSYVGAIESAEEFGPRIFTEAIRRGIRSAEMVIVLGDGAPWIWTLAAVHFPEATQIVDLYHAREHLCDLGKVLYEPESPKAKDWARTRIDELDAGGIEAVLAALRRLRPTASNAQDELRKATEYLKTNAERMRYDQFRQRGLFVGSGVVEAGCKTIIGRRLKQSGMHWTVRGAKRDPGPAMLGAQRSLGAVLGGTGGLAGPTSMTHTRQRQQGLRMSWGRFRCLRFSGQVVFG